MDITITVVTAKPALELLLAAKGFESPLLPMKESWVVFKDYLKLPVSAKDDQASFQTEWIRGGETDVFAARFVRQVTGDEYPRAIALEFLFEDAPAHVEEIAIWSRDYSLLDGFFHAVEHAEEFEYAVEATPQSGSLVEEEPER